MDIIRHDEFGGDTRRVVRMSLAVSNFIGKSEVKIICAAILFSLMDKMWSFLHDS